MSDIKKFSEYIVGDKVNTHAVIVQSSIRKTKAGKPYLAGEVLDGETKISFNAWDFRGEEPFMPNDVVHIVGSMGEYLGNKQLNVTSISVDKSVSISRFRNTGGYNIDAYYTKAEELIAAIDNELLSVLGHNLLEQLKQGWKECPSATGVHHAFSGGNLVHAVQVALLASSISETYNCNLDGLTINQDLVVFCGLFHDIGKLWGYKMNGVVPEMTDEGQLMEHIFMGAQMVDNFAENSGLVNTEKDENTMEIVKHIILSHHGRLEYGSPVTPQCIEALVVSAADGISAKCETIYEASCTKSLNDKWTEKLWGIDNRKCLTLNWVNSVMS